MRKFDTALITGASKGLGREIVCQLVKREMVKNLILVARNKKQLFELKEELENKYKLEGTIIILPIDLSCKDSFREIKNKNFKVDLLINNAGFGKVKSFEGHTETEIQEMIDVNIMMLTNLTHHYGRQMIEQRSGVIINVASVVGFMAVPLLAVYAATKSYVVSLSQALAVEWGKMNVHVKVFCPGGMGTNFHTTAGLSDEMIKRNELFIATAEASANDVIQLIYSHSSLKIPRFYNKTFKFCSWILPNSIVTRINEKIYKQKV